MAFRIVISHGLYLNIAVVCSSSCLSCALECSLLLIVLDIKRINIGLLSDILSTTNYVFSHLLCRRRNPKALKRVLAHRTLSILFSPFDILMEMSMA